MIVKQRNLFGGEDTVEGFNERKNKPSTCVDDNCQGGEYCSMCINRNIIAKEGYALIQIIERISASKEQTDAVIAADRFIKIAEAVLKGTGV